MNYTFQIYFLLFISYSILGWLMEVTVKYFQFRRFINRGFLIGPYCPIYGWGAILITLLLKKYIDDPIALFALGMMLCAILEYFASYLLEKTFKARWWDYSNQKFNINGRICLKTMIVFGLLGIHNVSNAFDKHTIKAYHITYNITDIKGGDKDVRNQLYQRS